MPTLSERAERKCTHFGEWIWEKTELPLTVLAAVLQVFGYLKLSTDRRYGEWINSRMALVPLRWFNANFDIATIEQGLTSMEAKAHECTSLDHLDDEAAQTRIDGFKPGTIFHELGSHAELLARRAACLIGSFNESIGISQTTGVLSSNAPTTEFSFETAMDYVHKRADFGFGVVECSVLSAVVQVSIFFLLVWILEWFCEKCHSSLVAKELWSKLRDAHFRPNFVEVKDKPVVKIDKDLGKAFDKAKGESESE